MNLLSVIGFIAVATALGAYGALFLKKGATSFSLHPLKLLKNWQFLLGGALYVFGWLAYILVLPTTPLSIAYPLTSMSYIWVTVLSARYLGEKVDAWRWAGIGFIICGIMLTSA